MINITMLLLTLDTRLSLPLAPFAYLLPSPWNCFTKYSIIAVTVG